MIDLISPLGRPPLDTFSPTQEVRTADVLPVGIWEVELGAAYNGGPTYPGVYFPTPAYVSPAGIRTGVLPGMELDLGIPAQGRRLLSVAYALLPGLLAFNAGWTPNPALASNLFEVGSELQLPTPWGTPRIVPQVAWIPSHPGSMTGTTITGTWLPRIDVGYDLALLRNVTAAADIDVDAGAVSQTDVALGLRVRLVDNLGGAIYASDEPGTGAVRGGVVLALRFFGR